MTSGTDTPSGPTARSTIRQSLETLLAEIAADPSSAFGYSVTAVDFGQTCEITVAKGDATFVLWLRPASDTGPCYRSTERFKIGHRQHPPDRLGYALLNAVCAQIAIWERSLPDGAQSQLFDLARSSLVDMTPNAPAALDAPTKALLSEASFYPIYNDWLAGREQRLKARFDRMEVGSATNILLVNATRGLQFLPSIVDFFALLQRTHDGFRVTSASYFDEIFELHEGIAAKGLRLVSVEEVMTWSGAEINRYGIVLMIGPSDVTVRLMAMEGLTAKLVLLDLGFYHQLIESHPEFLDGEEIVHNKSAQVNRVVAYSCQPQRKAANDLASACSPLLLEWQWFNYIPIGFSYCTYYRSDRHGFDVALLGSSGRDYAQIDPDRFRGVRFLFLGATENVPEIQRLRSMLDVTVVSRVNEDTYARLLALCRCVVFPIVSADSLNAFMSVVDTIATGKALVTPRHVGLARLEADGLPAVFYDHTRPADLAAQVDNLLHRDGCLQQIEARSIAFARERLDVYRVLSMILEEQVLRGGARRREV